MSEKEMKQKTKVLRYNLFNPHMNNDKSKTPLLKAMLFTYYITFTLNTSFLFAHLILKYKE